jgi:hypothetical protein
MNNEQVTTPDWILRSKTKCTPIRLCELCYLQALRAAAKKGFLYEILVYERVQVLGTNQAQWL